MKRTAFDKILGTKGTERNISAIAAVILIITVFVTGATVFGMMARHLERELENGLARSLGDKYILIHNEIDSATERTGSIGSGRLLLLRLMHAVNAATAGEEELRTLGAILDNARLEHKLSAIEIYDARGRTVAMRGEWLREPFAMTLAHPANTALLWRDGYYLGITVQVRDGDVQLGAIRLEMPLPAVTRNFENFQGLGETGEIALCGAVSPERMRCFPSRHRPEPFESPRVIGGGEVPLSLAIAGKSGVVTAFDYRAQKVIDAYQPLGDSGLGMVEKIDAAELEKPIFWHLAWIIPFLGALIIAGFFILRWKVGPLVREVLGSRLRIHAILDNSADGLITIDESGIIESFNFAAARIFGYASVEARGKNVTMLMPEALRGMHEAGLQHYLRTGEGKVIGRGVHEVQGLRKDGSIFPMELALGEMELGGKRLFIGSVRDTSALKQAHDELKSSFFALQVVNEELEETHAQLRQAEQDKNRQMEALAEANVRMVLFHSSMEQIQQADAGFLASGDADAFYHCALGEIMSLTGAKYGAVGLFDEQGKLGQFLTVGISEEERQKIGPYPSGKGLLQAFYRENAITRIDRISDDPRSCGFPPGHPPMSSLLGVPLNVNGHTRGVLYLSDKSSGAPFTEQDEMLVEMIAREVEHILERSELMARLRDSNQALTREKTEQQSLIAKLHEARDQLLQSEKMASIGQLAAGVAHEINNPIGYVYSNLGALEKYIQDLFSILDLLEAAENEFPPSSISLFRIKALKDNLDLPFLKEDIPSLMCETKEGIARVKKIVQDLKDFSHVDESEWQWSDLHKGLDSTLNIVWNDLKYKAEVVKEYGDLPEVECIPSQLNQVFMNLLVNAGHAIEDRGTITIRTGQDGNEVWVEIADNGKGIAPEHLKRIFDPFFTTKPVGKGTGLGLSLSYGIVKKHGGKIEVDSTPGKGTVFRVRLPVKQTDKAP